MNNDTANWAGRIVVAIFGGAFILTVVMFGIQAWSKVKGWWERRSE
jgi:hypothetical protein